MVIVKRLRVLLLTASCLQFVTWNSAAGQEKESESGKAEVGAIVKRAYENCNKATSQAEFSKSIALCDQGLALNATEPQRKYLKTLKSWALVSRAKLYPLEKESVSEKAESPSRLAIKDCDLAIQADASNWKAWAHRAFRFSKVGEPKKAISDLDSAIRKNPGQANLWFNRAELFFSQGDFEVAVTDYSEALKIEKNDVQALTGRAHAYLRLSKLELALADYNSVIERTAKSATAFLNRADLHVRMKNFKSAGEDYRAALTRDQTLAEAYRGVSWLYSASENDNYFNPTIADRAVKKAIELDGRETPENLVVLAAAQAAAGEYSMARDTIKRAKSAESVNEDVQAKVKFLENRKWFIAGTGQK